MKNKEFNKWMEAQKAIRHWHTIHKGPVPKKLVRALKKANKEFAKKLP